MFTVSKIGHLATDLRMATNKLRPRLKRDMIVWKPTKSINLDGNLMAKVAERLRDNDDGTVVIRLAFGGGRHFAKPRTVPKVEIVRVATQREITLGFVT